MSTSCYQEPVTVKYCTKGDDVEDFSVNARGLLQQQNLGLTQQLQQEIGFNQQQQLLQQQLLQQQLQQQQLQQQQLPRQQRQQGSPLFRGGVRSNRVSFSRAQFSGRQLDTDGEEREEGGDKNNLS